MGLGKGYRNSITASQAIAAARDSNGYDRTIAKRLRCSRSYVYKLRKKFPTFNAAVQDERERFKDYVERKLFDCIDNDDLTAIIFYLKTQAADRGYIGRRYIQPTEVKIQFGSNRL